MKVILFKIEFFYRGKQLRRFVVKVFVEYGVDFDNNRFGLGRSVELEKDDGTEYRTKQKVKLQNKAYYFRLWIGKTVFIISNQNGFEIVRKKRNNIKIVFGIEGEPI